MAFFEAMAVIAAAAGESDLRALSCLRYTPRSAGDYSNVMLHLDGQWYLCARLGRDNDGSFLEIIEFVRQN
jgi:plasmid maintenance system killer protein